MPSFRQAAERRRAVLPVNGWFEWRIEQGHKQPYHISDADQHVICLAAIWEPPAEGTKDETFAVLTTEPREELRRIHDRQPTVLEDGAVGLWLDGATDQEIAALVARQAGRRPLQIRRIDPTARMRAVTTTPASCRKPHERARGPAGVEDAETRGRNTAQGAFRKSTGKAPAGFRPGKDPR